LKLPRIVIELMFMSQANANLQSHKRIPFAILCGSTHHTDKISVFEASSKRRNNWDILFNALKAKNPISVASDRIFSIPGNFVSKIRTRLSHRSVDFYVFWNHISWRKRLNEIKTYNLYFLRILVQFFYLVLFGIYFMLLCLYFCISINIKYIF
jgi:hypothetical protein